jgi:tRNA modification GTPase
LRLLGRTRPLRPRHATFGRIVDQPGSATSDVRAVDQVVVTWFAAPRSYTGEDVVEIGAHGSDVLLGRIVDLAVRAGARLGEPGEFTFRAYLNGRLDLIQAEAVADLANAVTPLQARAAMDQLEGTLTEAIATVDARLFDLAARLEACLDFPEEGFHFVSRDQVASELARVRDALEALVRDGRAGRVVREGSLVVIAGRPNAGKSSLFNALAGASRAIVTDVPGTTRDLLTERVDIGGVPITLVDTAGLRDVEDAIEVEGVRRAREAQGIAALTLMVVDGSVPQSPEAIGAAATDERSTLIVLSKSDLRRAWTRNQLAADPERIVDVSVVTGEGLEDLRRRIVQVLTTRDEWRDPPAVSNLRHIGHLEDALESIARVEGAIAAGTTEELILAELADARRSLEAMTGRRAPDDLLRHIFSRFCIGK